MLTFESFEFHAADLRAEFFFALDGESFRETLRFHFPPAFKLDLENEHLPHALFTAHLALGISCWKIAAPPSIQVKSGFLPAKERKFWHDAWEHGLGEFFFENNIDFRGLVNFENAGENAAGKFAMENLPVANVGGKSAVENVGENLSGKSAVENVRGEFAVENASENAGGKLASKNGQQSNLLFFGGGKDSLVGAKLLQKAGIGFTPLIFGQNEIAAKQGATFGPPIFIERKLDRKIFAKNASGKFFNGHVPFSLILACAANVAAVLCGAQHLIACNEKSANFGNTNFLGKKVNHQWSKSFAAEKMMGRFFQRKFGKKYFSLLRPLWEIQIAKLFGENCQEFFSSFASCNRNFRQSVANLEKGKMWCCACPKCAFVFTLLAAFLPRETVVEMFGENLFAKKGLLKIFRELMGQEHFKPFECVGEKNEVIAAAFLAMEKFGQLPGEESFWENFTTGFLHNKSGRPCQRSRQRLQRLTEKLMSNFGPHCLPESFQIALRELIASRCN